MTTSQTIDVTKYIQTSIGSEKASKSYIDNSHKFGDILENINKTYTSDNNVSQDKTQPKVKASASKKTENTSKSQDEDVSSNKVDNQKDSQADDVKNDQTTSKKEQTSTKEEEKNTSVSDKTENSTDNSKGTSDSSDSSNTSDSKKDTGNNSNTNDETAKKSADSSSGDITNNSTKAAETTIPEEAKATATQIQIQAKSPEELPTTTNTTIKTEETVQIVNNIVAQAEKSAEDTKTSTKTDPETNNQIAINVNTGLESILTNMVQAASTQNNSQPTITTEAQPEVGKTQSNIQNLNVNLTANVNNLTGEIKHTKPVVSQATTQAVTQATTQAQQELNKLTNSLPDTNQSLPVTTPSEGTTTPVIEVKAESVLSDTDLSTVDTNVKKDANELLNKATVTQDLLDKTNAKITNIEKSTFSSSNQNNNGFLGKQNAQEQVVKLQLENSTISNGTNVTQDVTQNIGQSMAQNVGLVSTPQINNQPAFSNVVNNTAQTPKDISQNEIVSQINNQISTKNLQDEGTTKINIILKPENLGKINLELVNSKEGLTAQLTTNNSQVKEILDKNMDSLRDTLNSQGINVNNVTVKVNETQKQSNQDMAQFENQMGQNNQQTSDNTKNKNESEYTGSKESNSNIGMNDAADSSESANESTIENVVETTTTIKGLTGKVNYKV